MVRTLHFHCRGPGSIPGRGTKIPQATWDGQKKKNQQKQTKKLHTNKSPKLDNFTVEFHQTYEEEHIPILLKLFQTTEEEGRLPNSFSKAIITLIPNQTKNSKKKKKERKLQASIFDEYRCKNPQVNISNPTIHKKDDTP